MARSASPPRFNRERYYDPSYTAEITAKMQVPKRIKIDGSQADEEEFTAHLPWQPEKIDMRVPDRILVAGQNKHIGTPAPPRELIVENTIMPPDPGMIRIHTPPRSITLDEHYFPSAADDFEKDHENSKINGYSENNAFGNLDKTQTTFAMDQTINNRDFSTMAWDTGPFLKTEEEIVHLRKQLLKMNRKVVNIEREIVSKNQRDKILFGVATAYLLIKLCMWMSRNN